MRGEPRSVTELRNETILIEVLDEKESLNISKLEKPNNIPVKVEEYTRLSTVQGTIYHGNQPNYSEDDLLNALKNQHANKIFRIKRNRNGTFENTNIFIITFNLFSFPSNVNIGWIKCTVREYIPNPRQCFTCQQLGHGANTCRGTTGVWYRCGEAPHDDVYDRPIKYSNWSSNHPASSRECFYYILEKETLTMQTRENSLTQ